VLFRMSLMVFCRRVAPSWASVLCSVAEVSLGWMGWVVWFKMSPASIFLST